MASLVPELLSVTVYLQMTTYLNLRALVHWKKETE